MSRLQNDARWSEGPEGQMHKGFLILSLFLRRMESPKKRSAFTFSFAMESALRFLQPALCYFTPLQIIINLKAK